MKSSICFFRTLPKEDKTKLLIQVTEKCNLNCHHCFNNSELDGEDLNIDLFKVSILPYIRSLNVESITLTGGEPLLLDTFDELVEILKDYRITICTNGTLITEEQCLKLKKFKNIKFNVSLDGFSSSSHDYFRNTKNAFIKTKSSIELLVRYELIKGILVTPNIYSNIDEYLDLYEFANKHNIEFVLFNRIFPIGRGEKSAHQLNLSLEEYQLLKDKLILQEKQTELFFAHESCENRDDQICEIGKLRYIYVNGDTVFCPYISFSNQEKCKNYIRNICGNIYDSNLPISNQVFSCNKCLLQENSL